jgi:hypothetical protein
MREERYIRMRHLVGSMAQASPKPLPAQFTGKRQLLEALLLDAIRTFRLLVHARKPGERQQFREVEEWITTDDTDYPFSFVNVCAFLGVSADAVRSHLLRWKVAQSRTGGEEAQAQRGRLRIVQR